MHLGHGYLTTVVLAALLAVACGGKTDDPVGSASADQSDPGAGSGACKPMFVMGGGGGTGPSGGAGPMCISMTESASCGTTTYTVNCSCPELCDCIVNGETVGTAATTSCSKPGCPLPDDAWKTCGFPAVPDMP
jgi:hypothetical protein